MGTLNYQERWGKPVTYSCVHRRVWSKNGPARSWLCIACGNTANDWAYLHNAPNELTQPTLAGRVHCYSADIGQYVPMCKRCHGNFDTGKKYKQAT
jgi:hypothetical protein